MTTIYIGKRSIKSQPIPNRLEPKNQRVVNKQIRSINQMQGRCRLETADKTRNNTNVNISKLYCCYIQKEMRNIWKCTERNMAHSNTVLYGIT